MIKHLLDRDDVPVRYLKRLIETALRITAERDIYALFEEILNEAQRISNADGGTVYMLVEQDGQQMLEFTIVKNFSLHISQGRVETGAEVSFKPVPLFLNGTPNHSNIVSHVALTGDIANIEDAYANERFDFSGTREVDLQLGYRSKSFLTIPLKNEHSKVIGVIQLINARSDDGQSIVGFDTEIEPVIEILAAFAAMALESQLKAKELEQKDLLVELSSEPSTSHLIDRILREAQTITRADGGTLYLYRQEEHASFLDFTHVRNDSLGVDMGGVSGNPLDFPPIPVIREDGSQNVNHIASFSAITKEVVNIKDVYQETKFDFTGAKNFDKQNKYHSKSFLTVPLLNHENDVIGVLQLINAQDIDDGTFIPFSRRIEPIVKALASYAAIALNNQLLLRDLKNLLDAFIQCIAQAIDAKSPQTSAHCQRIPLLMELIARAACEDEGKFADFRLNEEEWYELKVASWLHDCGKLATPDWILDKATKLHVMSDRIDEINARFASIKQHARVEALEAMLEQPDQREQLEQQLNTRLAEIEEIRTFVNRANKGGEFMSAEDQQRIREIAHLSWIDAEGLSQPLLTEFEVMNLVIERGTLTREERDMINNHMQVTIDMLESLPFPKGLRRVSEYAGGHHEKMDGSGFPKGLTRDEMSIPARMMAVADIFEALTSRERPYKDPMPLSVALNILKNMRNNRHIDPDVYELFVQARVWEQYAELELDPAQKDVEDISPYLENLEPLDYSI